MHWLAVEKLVFVALARIFEQIQFGGVLLNPVPNGFVPFCIARTKLVRGLKV